MPTAAQSEDARNIALGLSAALAGAGLGYGAEYLLRGKGSWLGATLGMPVGFAMLLAANKKYRHVVQNYINPPAEGQGAKLPAKETTPAVRVAPDTGNPDVREAQPNGAPPPPPQDAGEVRRQVAEATAGVVTDPVTVLLTRPGARAAQEGLRTAGSQEVAYRKLYGKTTLALMPFQIVADIADKRREAAVDYEASRGAQVFENTDTGARFTDTDVDFYDKGANRVAGIYHGIPNRGVMTEVKREMSPREVSSKYNDMPAAYRDPKAPVTPDALRWLRTRAADRSGLLDRIPVPRTSISS